MFEVKVGDKVGYGKHHFESLLYAGESKVAKINGHGHIILENGRVFDKYGNERKVGQYGGYAYLIAIDSYRAHFAEKAAFDARRMLVNNINYIIKQNMGGGGKVWSFSDEDKLRLQDMVGRL